MQHVKLSEREALQAATIETREDVQRRYGFGVCRAIAACASSAGIAERTWRNWEAGTSKPRILAVKYVSRALLEQDIPDA